MSALEELTARAVMSPLWFLKRWTPAAVPANYAPYHEQLVALPDAGHAQMRTVFRGAAKTTVTRGLILHACGNPHVPVKGILLIRAVDADADADREALLIGAAAAGIPAYEQAKKKMVVLNGVPVWTRTPGGAVRGINWVNPDSGEVIRPDLAVIDDLETRQSARSAMQTRNIREWLFSDVMQAGGQGNPMRTVMLGTPITPNCLISQAMRGTAPFDTWDTPLVVPIIDGQGVPAWPDNFNTDWDALIPDITRATEFMLDPLPPGTLLFHRPQTRWDALPATHRWPLVLACDPAGDGEDATAVVAMCMTTRGLHIVDVLHHTAKSEDAPNTIAAFARKLQAEGWKIRGLAFEDVGFASFMRREVAAKIAPIPVKKETPTESKLERLLPLTVWHKAGALSVDPRLDGSAWDVEFHSFQHDGQTVTGHDDCSDATAWAAAPLTRGWSIHPPKTA
jgi:hypothetical protein